MRIQDLADKGATSGHWSSITYNNRRDVYHYATLMLSFGIKDNDPTTWDGDIDTVAYSTGHGSVSDQNGMNKLFARQAMPFYYQRSGGAQIVTLDGPNYRYGITPRARVPQLQTSH